MFYFKQFSIEQDRTAMKVCTDACILGAYANVGQGGLLLDIGTGTGLLALMAAQRNTDALIDAVEIDENAYTQAAENVAASPFSDRIRVHWSPIQTFAQSGLTLTYDRILSNPPFYTNQLRSPNAIVNRALHNDELPFEELISSVLRLLKRDGEFWILLPPSESKRVTRLAEGVGLQAIKRLAVRHQATKPVFREIIGFHFADWGSTIHNSIEELFIYESDGKTYTEPFRQLLQVFYVIF